MKIHKAVAELAHGALLREVSATPKPGLVDRNNSGAHSDMDIFTFIDSAYALLPHFAAFAAEGENAKDLPSLFSRLRLLGTLAERDMYGATNGVNTHKGAIFSLGLLCGGAGFLHGRGKAITAESLCSITTQMCKNLCSRELENAPAQTRGQQIYKKYGAGGPRFEAENGFPSVVRFGLPVYERNLRYGENTALVRALISLMANVFDTNILGRHNMETAKQVMVQASDLLSSPIDAIVDFDRMLIAKNISPGGSADLLAVTYFLHNIWRLA